MKLRRIAMLAGGTLTVVLLGGGYLAERSGVDLTLFVDKLIARVSSLGEAKKAAPANSHGEESDTAELQPAAKGDRLVQSRESALPDPRPDMKEIRDRKAEHGSGETESKPSKIAGKEAGGEESHPSAHDEDRQLAHGQEGGGEKHADQQGEHNTDASGEFDADAHLLPPGEHQPWRVFRRLQRVQDRIVEGDPGSLKIYREAMAGASQEMLALPAQTWSHERNVLAAAAYVMAGGKPELASHVLGVSDVEGEARTLLEGALAYAQGKYYEAYTRLYHIQPEKLPISIAGQVALVKAMLLSPRDLEKAADFLVEARRMAPGTLVEEAALRRLIRVKAETEDVDGFFEAAKAYARRFPKSVFLADFLRNFAFGSLRLPDQQPDRLPGEVDEIAARIDLKARVFMFSLVARGATVFGKFDLARDVSKRSLELVRDDPRLEQRLKLYLAASSLNQPDLIGEAGKELAGIDASALDANDERLLQAARTVVEKIEEPLNEAILNIPETPDTPGLGAESTQSGEQTDPIKVSNVRSDTLPPILARSGSMLDLADQAMGW